MADATWNALRAGIEALREYTDTCEALDAMEAALAAQQPAQGEAVVPADVQRVIDRLMSSDPDFDDCEDAADMLRRLASAPPAPSVSVPDGWKLVPVEPTDGMLIAARDWSNGKYGKPVGDDGAMGCYAAMLAAAPEVPRG